ncbi:MAG TPA: lactate utilization protein [Chloroflexota bacterium]|nr:lactate utilization protein [Chloroflexota bacterium]
MIAHGLSSLAAAFVERAASVGTQTHPARRAGAPRLIVQLVAGERASRVALDTDTRARLPESTSALAAARRAVLPPDAAPSQLADADAGVSWAAFGVAETGSVALAARATSDRLVGMLPPLHVVLLAQSQIVPDLDAAAARLRDWTAGGARQPYVSLVTGASRTSDIERVLTIGVHGPRVQHVLLLTDE